jgi:DNA-binding NarL/FixJ family response regulator
MEAELNEPVCVAILEQNSRLRQQWLEGLAHQESIRIVGWVQRVEELVAIVNSLAPPQVILIDLSAATTALIGEFAEKAKVIVLHDTGEEEAVLEALRAGAMGHLEKSAAQTGQILAAIQIVSRGQAVLSPSLAGRLVERISRFAPPAH